MKRILISLVSVFLLAISVVCMADSDMITKPFTFTPRAAYTYLLNKDLKSDIGNPIGIRADFDWSACPISLEAGYQWSKKNDIKHTYIPVFASYENFDHDQMYFKVAPGICFAKHDGEKNNKFAFEIGVGYYFSYKLSAELCYTNFNKVYDKTVHGITLSLGYDF